MNPWLATRYVSKRMVKFCILVSLLMAVAGLYWLADGMTWRGMWQKIRYWPRLYTTSSAFHDTIGKADRLVVRYGGFDCCGSVEDQEVLFEITDPAELERIHSNLQFMALKNEALDACGCCGFPGLDWYKGRKRIALTAVQHGMALRWTGFPAGYYWPGNRYAGDVPLTLQSSIWLTEWVISHGIVRSDYSADKLEKLRQSANRPSEANP